MDMIAFCHTVTLSRINVEIWEHILCAAAATKILILNG